MSMETRTRITDMLHGKERLAIVTGGTRGIGRALVDQLVEHGWRVVATGRTASSCEEAALRRPSVRWLPCELANQSSRRAFLAAIDSLRPDLFVHNAGMQVVRDFVTGQAGSEFTPATEIEVNLIAPIELTQALLPAMARGSCLVFVTSGLALAPKQSSPVYCAGKAGLRSFAKSLRAQLAASGVRVTEALPPMVDTDMTRGRGRRKMAPEAVAKAIMAGIESGRDEIYIGAARVLRWVMRLSPRAGEALMIRH
jgi:uncharacterized oxidoreductase